MIGCFKVEVVILTLKWRKKPFLPRKKSLIRPIAHILLGVDLSATITVSPTVSFLLGRNHFWRSCSKGRYSYFQRPQKTFVKILNLSPSSPGISVVFLLTALAVEIDFGELHILGHSPPTQAQMMIGNWAPLPNGHCGWTQCNSWWSFISRIGFSVIMHFQWGGLDSYGDTVGNIHGENASTHSQCCVSLSYSPCKRGLYRSVTLTSSSRFF